MDAYRKHGCQMKAKHSCAGVFGNGDDGIYPSMDVYSGSKCKDLIHALKHKCRTPGLECQCPAGFRSRPGSSRVHYQASGAI